MTDGSKFDISNIINDYKKRDSRVVFDVSNKNKGVSHRRNLAIDAASGKYIQFVDADDYIEPDMVERMYDGMHHGKCDISVCAVADMHFPVANGVCDSRVLFSRPSLFNYIQYTNFVTNKLFKLSIIRDNKIRFQEKVKLGEDALFCCDYFKNVKYITCIDKELYHYIPNPESATVRYDANYVDYERLVVESITELFTEYGLCNKEQDVLRKWQREKILCCIGYYRERKKKGVVTDHEFRKKVKRIRLFDSYNSLNLTDKLKMAIAVVPGMSRLF